MRRFAITTFALLYGILVLLVSAERFNEWAAQEAPGHGHFAADQHFPSFSKPGKSEPHLQYKRIIERAFVVESPRVSAGVSMPSVRHTPMLCFEYEAAWNGWTVSLRAPPFYI
jgi:hypothetical protein